MVLPHVPLLEYLHNHCPVRRVSLLYACLSTRHLAPSNPPADIFIPFPRYLGISSFTFLAVSRNGASSLILHLLLVLFAAQEVCPPIIISPSRSSLTSLCRLVEVCDATRIYGGLQRAGMKAPFQKLFPRPF